MKVSLDLIKFINAKYDLGSDPAKLGVDKLIKKIGSQLGAVEEVIDTRGKYDGIKVVEIVEAKDHPDADKLNVYKINDGKNLVQVVSGDRNLNVGDKVAWLAPGTTVPTTWGTDKLFKLDARQLRGEMSHGMFGSGKELDINEDQEKVLVLDTDAPAGTPLSKAYPLEDVVVDIENKMFTHRPDCFGILGVDRELLGIQGQPFNSPSWYTPEPKITSPEGSILKLEVINEIPKLVPRFVAVAVKNVKVGPSPVWLQARLKNLGVKPINNIVDITNFYMVETGQPLHAYDYDKVLAQDPGAKSARLVVRAPKKHETLELLDNKTIELSSGDMIVSTALKPVCLGGMMGGVDTGIDFDTKNIILEAATWDMYSIRRSSMKHGIFTDAVTRFSKGQSPLQNLAVIGKALEDIEKLTGGKVASKVIDENNVDKKMLQRSCVHPPITISADFINHRLGARLDSGQIAKLLRNVEFRVEEQGEELLITAPFWRTDIEIKEDIVEEIGRMHSYDKLPQNMPLRFTTPVEVEPLEVFKDNLRSILTAAGANELQTYSFVPAKLLDAASQDEKLAFTIRNAISPELQKYRLSITPSLAEKVHANVKAGQSEFAVFEIGKPHIKFALGEGSLPKEYKTLAFVYTSEKPLVGAAYYNAKKYLDHLLGSILIEYRVVKINNVKSSNFEKQMAGPYNHKRTAAIMVGDSLAGFVGEFTPRISKALKLPAYSAGFEVDLEILLNAKTELAYKPIIKYPSTTADICFNVAADILYSDLIKYVTSALPGDSRLRTNISPVDIYQKADDKSNKQITIRLSMQHHDRTLETSEVNDWLDDITKVVTQNLNAKRI